jgi:short subunit dehydrogenase-like uncharacterized protein
VLYGANGYTGTLCAEEAVRRGLTPILAGRREDAVRPLAERLGLAWRAFAVDDVGAGLDGVAAVLSCAGPFSVTAAPLVAACLAAGASYLDVTGEVDVLEAVYARHDDAVAAGVALVPGVGFDVVPTDCLAARLAEALPGARRLELAVATRGSLSRGTARTMIENLGKPGVERKDGRLVPVALAQHRVDVPFADKPRSCVSIPWGDLASAWRTTGVPDIVTYAAIAPAMALGARALGVASPLLGLAMGLPFVQELIGHAVGRLPEGPTAERRESGRAEVWGRVTDEAGKQVSATLTTAEPYQLTARSAVRAIERVLAGVPPGAHTPSRAFGAGLVGELGHDVQLLP